MASTTLARFTAFRLLILFMVISASVTGCSSEVQPSSTTTSPTATSAEATKPVPTDAAKATGENPSEVPVGAAGKLNVVVTTTQIRSMTESVAGNLADVRSILTPGADPHEFEPRPSDVAAIATATLVLKSGVGLDDWVDKIILNAGGQRPLVTVSKGVPVRKGDEQEPVGDPHIWFSVANAMTMTINIRDALIQADGAHAATYNSNTEAYLARLRQLDTYIRDAIANIPPGQRKMVTNHDAFG